MLSFKMGALADWVEVDPSQVIALHCDMDFRKVSFDVMCDGVAGVIAACGDQSYLVALGEGLMEVSFTIDQPCGVSVFSDTASRCWIRTKDRPQLIDESGEAPFTSIEPRGDAADQKYRRMMLLMNRNIEKRLSEQQAEYERRIAQIEAAKSEEEKVVEDDKQD